MTKQDKAHTELPWKTNGRFVNSGFDLVAKAGPIGCAPPDKKSSADAAFIVTACNEHYENRALISDLVEALEWILAEQNTGTDPADIYGTEMWKFARAALSKAKGGEQS